MSPHIGMHNYHGPSVCSMLNSEYLERSLTGVFVFILIPFFQKNDENGNCSGEGIEFPTTNLYELESRVLTDHWSIPYKREESLGKCLLASTYLARLGKISLSYLRCCYGTNFIFVFAVVYVILVRPFIFSVSVIPCGVRALTKSAVCFQF